MCDGKKWSIKFYLINLEGIDVNINPRQSFGGLVRNSLKVGDRVGWHSKLGYDLYAVVEKLNPKKALVRLSDGEQWGSLMCLEPASYCSAPNGRGSDTSH